VLISKFKEIEYKYVVVEFLTQYSHANKYFTRQQFLKSTFSDKHNFFRCTETNANETRSEIAEILLATPTTDDDDDIFHKT
jgi:hypothetical protein